MPPKRTSKGKEKVGSSSGTARTREPEGGVRRFLSSDTAARYANVVRDWAIIPERPVQLEDFPNFELTYLVHNCGWEKVIERPHPVYENLAKEFYANFNTEIDTPGSEHLHQTWVRGKWIMFSPEVIHDYYQLSWNNVVPIPEDFNWHEVAEILLGRENAWPLPTADWHQIELTPSIAILWLFMCHNVEPISHRTTFTNPRAGFIYHLVRGNKIDLATYIYNQILGTGTWGDRHYSLIFPSLICGICRAAGIQIQPGEAPEKPSPFIKQSTLEAQDRARLKHQQKLENARRRRQLNEEGQADADLDMPPIPPPPQPDMDSQVLRQIFTTTTGISRDVQSLQQAMGTLTTEVHTAHRDVRIASDMSRAARQDAQAARREMDTMNGRLSVYVGRVDGIQLRVNETWEHLGRLETRVEGIHDEMTQQSALMREIISRLPSPPADHATGPSYTPRPPL
jgi:hypothetical protein